MKNSNSFLGKILYRYFIIAAVFFLILSGVICYSGLHSASLKEKEVQAEDISLIRSSFDNIFSVIINSAKYIMEDNEFVRYGLTDDGDQATILKLVYRLNDISALSNSNYFKLGIYKTGTDGIITVNKYENSEIFMSEHSMTGNDFNMMLKYFEKAPAAEYYIHNKLMGSYLFVAARRVFSNSETAYVMMFFDINEIMPLSTDDTRSCYLVYNGTPFAGSAEYGKIAKKLEGKLSKNNECVFSDGGRYVGAARSEVLPDFVYVCSQDKSNSAAPLLFAVLLSMLALAALVLYILFMDANRMYEPIENMKKSLAQIRKSENGGDELLEIQKLVMDVARENLSLSSSINNRNMLLKNKLIVDFAYGNLTEREKQAAISEFKFKDGTVIAALLEFADGEAYADEIFLSMRLRLYSRFEHILETEKDCMIAYLDLKRYLLICVGKSAENVELLLKQLIRIAEEEFDIILIAAMGEKADSLYNAEKSFLSAQYLMEYKYATRRKSVITTDNLKIPRKINYYYPIEVESMLISYVVNGEKEKCINIIKSVIENNFSKTSLDYNTITELKFAIVATMKRCLQLIDKTADEVFDEGMILYLELNKCNDAKLLEEKIIYFFETIINSVDADTLDESKQLAEKIKGYIDENFGIDISLTQISDKFCLSEGYISKIFKIEFGINFKTYLNRLRVEKAKEIMLNERNVKISDVAERVGCNNASTFIRVFKTHTGMSPKAFLKENLK